MRSTYAAILSIMLLLAIACAPKVDDPVDVQAIKQVVADFAKATTAGDAGAIADSTTDKTIFAYPNSPGFVGKEAIRSMHQAFAKEANSEFGAPVEEVRVIGDLAIARGTWTEKVTPKAQGLASVNYGGSWAASFARQSDGSWKWDWLFPNSNQPLPGSTASGEDEKALYQIEREMAEALVKKDAAAWDRMLASEFQANYAGFVGNRKQFLADLKSNAVKFESATNSEMQAVVLGGTAIVHGLMTSKSSMGGKDTSGQDRYTDVFVKRDGRWQCVTGHSIKVQ
jgi:uncharacterized protein (TIGR02246 family)